MGTVRSKQFINGVCEGRELDQTPAWIGAACTSLVSVYVASLPSCPQQNQSCHFYAACKGEKKENELSKTSRWLTIAYSLCPGYHGLEAFIAGREKAIVLSIFGSGNELACQTLLKTGWAALVPGRICLALEWCLDLGFYDWECQRKANGWWTALQVSANVIKWSWPKDISSFLCFPESPVTYITTRTSKGLVPGSFTGMEGCSGVEPVPEILSVASSVF